MKKNYILILIFVIMAMLPAEAMATKALSDGQYTVAVTLSGGSGRVTVESPAELVISNGTMTAVIRWSSPYYDLMLIDGTGTDYYPINTEGNSVFEIPVLAMDEDIKISAETTAMSAPHLIEYTLRFDSSTLRASASGNQTAVLIVMAGAVILPAIVLLLRRKNKPGKGL